MANLFDGIKKTVGDFINTFDKKAEIDPKLKSELEKRGMKSQIEDIQSSYAKSNVSSNLADTGRVIADITGAKLSNVVGASLSTPLVNKYQRELTRTENELHNKIISKIQDLTTPREQKIKLLELDPQSKPIIDSIPELKTTAKEIWTDAGKLALTAASLFNVGSLAGKTALSELAQATKALSAYERVRKYGKMGQAVNVMLKSAPQFGFDAAVGGAYGIVDAIGKNKSIDEVKKQGLIDAGINVVVPVAFGLVLRGLAQGLKYTGKGIADVSIKLRNAAEQYALGTTIEERIINAKNVQDKALSIYQPAKTASQKIAGEFVKSIDYLRSIPERIYDAGSSLNKYSRDSYLEFRLGRDAAKDAAYRMKDRLANQIFSKDDNIYNATKAKLTLLDQLERARLGDEIAYPLDIGDTTGMSAKNINKLKVDALEKELIKMDQGLVDSGIAEVVQKSIDDYNDFNLQLLQEKVGAGYQTRESIETLTTAHPNYIPHSTVARVLEDGTPDFIKATRNPSKSTIMSSTGGSTRALEDPIDMIYNRIDEHYQALSNSKLTDSLIKDDTAKLFTPVRTAANVLERKELIKQMSIAKQDIGKLSKVLKRTKKEDKVLQSKMTDIESNISSLNKYMEDKFNLFLSDDGELLQMSKAEFDDIGKQIMSLKNKLGKLSIKDEIASKIISKTSDKLQELHDLNKSNYNKVVKELGDLKMSSQTMAEKGLMPINRWVNGVKETYLVPEEVAVAVKNLNQEASTGFVKYWGKVNDVFKGLTTGYNLPFAVSNLAKDRQTAYIMADTLINNYLKSAGLPVGIRKNIGLDSKGLVDLYRKVGGSGADIISDTTLKSGQKTFEEMRKSGFAKVISNSYRPDKAIAFINKELEKSTRLQVFKRALESGVSEREAALIARDATVDFSKMGTQMKVLNQVFPFLNARVQGAINMVKAAGMAPEVFARKMYYSAVVPSVILDQYNSQFKSDANVSTHIRDNYWYIITGEQEATDKDGRKVLIPQMVAIKKGEIQQVASIGISEFLRRMRGESPKSYAELSFKMLGSISPIGTGGYNPQSWFVAPLAATGPITKSLIGMGTNIDPYTGLDIIPSEKLGAKSNALKYSSNTRELSKQIGATLNTSPAMIEFIVNSFGAVPKQALQTADIIQGLQKGEGIRGKSISDTKFGQMSQLPWLDTFIKEGAYIGSDPYKESLLKAQEIKGKQIDINIINKETADMIVDNAFKIKDMEERKAYLNEARKNYSPDIIKRAATEYRSRNAEGFLRPGMDTEVVANFVYKEILDMQKNNIDNKEILEYLNNLKKKNIITDESAKKIKGLNQYGLYIDDVENAPTIQDKTNIILSAVVDMKNKGIEKSAISNFLLKMFNDGYINDQTLPIIRGQIQEIFKKNQE